MYAVENNPETLQEHMTQTYVNLRVGIGVIAAVLPLLLFAGGRLTGIPGLLQSMSHYYYSDIRDIFVGAVVFAGVGLYLYKGFCRPENWALNLGGFLAVGVAMFPTGEGEEWTTVSVIHSVCAVGMFLCIAYVSIFRATDTLSLLDDEKIIARFRRTYRALGIGMIVSPLIAVVLNYGGTSFTFYVEAAAVEMFAAYWLVKSYELSRTKADKLALAGEVQAVPEAATAGKGRLVRAEK
ncbi:MAG TPA: hypothetical protein VKB93_00895 [Thermoanaerobaculia bacterium]|nr:hypothetical protein [Thermoanaerobaculia bacterium]